MNTIYSKVRRLFTEKSVGNSLGIDNSSKNENSASLPFLGKGFDLFVSSILLFLFTLSNQISAQTTTVTTYSSPGVYTWTAPAGITSITVQAWGGGGGGGGGSNGLLGLLGGAGGGGGGGAYVTSVLTVVPGTTYNVGVGAGGGGGSAANNGTAGNDSYFNSLAVLKAVGGSFGVGNGAGGAGGSSGSSVGTTKYSGGSGSAGGVGLIGLGSFGGGGGSSGGTAAVGGNGSNGTGGSVAGGGSGGSSNGNSGASPGGGGAGRYAGSGGNGGLGQVKITYSIPATLVIGTNAAVIAANICPSTTTVPLHSFSITGANNPGNITQITAYLYGSYLSSDITNLKLWTTGTSSTFAATTQLGSTQASPAPPLGPPGQARVVTFSGLTTNVGNATHYFWVTMDVTASAASSRTIYAIGTLPVNVTATPTPTGNSNLSGTQTLGVGATPTAPVAIAATPVACTSFTAKWNASASTSSYELDVSTSPTFASFLAGYNDLNVGNVTSKSVTGLTANTTYYYRVRADKCGSTSTNSNAITVTTSAVPADPGNPTSAGSCSPPSFILTRSGAPGAGITWYWQGTDAAGTSTALNSTSTYAATATGTYYIRASTAGGCWSAGSGSITLTVGDVTGGTIADHQSICGSTNPAAFTEVVAATGTGMTHTWQEDDNSAFSSPTTIAGATDNVYDPPAIASTTYYRRVATVGSCSAYSNTIEITVSPTPTIVASADVTICSGSSTNLSASGGIANTYSWLNTTGLSNAAIYNPVASPTTTTTYTVTAWGVSTEKVVNPGFESGNSGFSSQYTYTVGANSLQGEGKYAIVNGNASGVHTAFRGLPRSGSYQMVINGASNPGANVYCQDFTVAPNSDYAFSSWISTVHPGDGTLNGRAKLQFSINGIVIGSPFYSPAMPSYPTPSGWSQFFATWNSGTSTTATICIVNLNVTANGNDFALDDMSFAPYCSGQDVVTVTVPQPVLSSTLFPAGVCSGSAFSYTATSASPSPTFTWSRATVAGISNGASSGTGNVNETLINTTSAPINVTYVYRTRSQGCTGVAQNVVVTINPAASLSSALTKTICSGANVNYQATSSTSGATFAWTRATVAGISEAGTSGTGDVSEVLTNTTGVSVNVTYVYTTSSAGCSSSSQNVVVTVKGSAKLSSSLTPPAICSAATFAYTATSATAGATFAWSRAAILGISQAQSSGTGNVSETLTNTTASAIDVTYVYVTTANGCSNTQNVVVSVKPAPQLNSTLTGSLCSGSTFGYTATSATAGPPSFSWTRAGVAGINAGAAGSGTGNISEVLSITSGTSALNATYVYTSTLNGCTGATQNLVVTVNPIPVLSSATAPSAICSGTTFGYTATSATAGATFSWSRAAVAGITEAATAGTLPISEELNNTTTAAIPVVYSYITTAAGCSNSGQNVTVSVKPLPILNSTLAPAAICSGATFGYTATSATGGGSATFAWSRATVTGITEAGNSGSSNPISQVLTNTTTSAIDVTYVYATTYDGCTGASQNVVVSVKPAPQGTFYGNTICDAPPGQIAQLTFSSTSGTGPFTLIYNNPVPAAITKNGAVTNTPFASDPNQTAVGTYVYTLTSITDANGCVRTAGITDATADVIVTSGQITSDPSTPASSVTCAGTTASFFVDATGVQTYAWQVNTTGANGGTYDENGVWTTIVASGTSPTYNGFTSATLVVTNTNTSHDGYRFRSVMTAACGPNVTSSIARMTINTLPVLTSSLAPTPATCSGESVVYTPTSGTAGATFAWTRAAVTGITTTEASSGTGAISGDTLINETVNPINVIYVYSTTNPANGCVTLTENVVVTINPAPELSSLTGTVASSCSPANFSYTPESESIGSTFAWTRPAVAGITTSDPASGTGSIAGHVLTNTTTASINVLYIYVTTASSCSGPPDTVIITVKPSPTLSSSTAPPTICTAVNNFAYTATSATAGASFAWTRATIAGILEVGTSGTGNISETLTNTTTSYIDVTYVYTVTAGGCTGSPVNVVVRVRPVPVLNTSLTQSVCSASLLTYNPGSATVGSTFAWTRATVTNISPVGTTGTEGVSETLTITGGITSPIDVVYVYTTTAGGCSGPAQNVVVTVNPLPSLSSDLTPDAVCSETVVAFGYTATSATSGATFAWTRAAIADINANVSGSGTGNVSEVLTNTSAAAVDVTYVYTTTANGCSTSQNVVVSVKPRPVLSSTGTANLCSGSTLSYTATSATAGASFSWTRPAVTGISQAASSGTSNPVSEVLTNTTTSAIDVDYIYYTTAAACSTNPPDTVRVTVAPKPNMTSAAVATICTGTSLATNGTLTFTSDITSTFAWTRANTVDVGPAGPTSGSSNPVSEVLTNTTAASIATTYVVTPTAGGCAGTPQNVVVDVTPIPATPNAINGNPN